MIWTLSLEKLARERGFEYIQGKTVTELVSFLREAKRDMQKRTRRSKEKQNKLVDAIKQIEARSATSREAIARSYDEEYRDPDTRYGYVSAMLSPKWFDVITGLDASTVKNAHVIDVGAGSNEFLRFCRDELKIPASHLHGLDVSTASRDIIASDGFTAHLGSLEEAVIPYEAFDLVYLSYFIDYDTNQEATFNSAIDIAKPGGTIVLEGLFPVRPFGLSEKDASTHAFVTEGKSASEDIRLVAESFSKLGSQKGKTVSLQRVLKTHRFVQSHYGLNQLPSYFLTFTVSSEVSETSHDAL